MLQWIVMKMVKKGSKTVVVSLAVTFLERTTVVIQEETVAVLPSEMEVTYHMVWVSMGMRRFSNALARILEVVLILHDGFETIF